MSKIYSFVGYSGCGKTTLIEKLVHDFCGRGLRVATIKHAHHRVFLDTPGKDSWRFRQAGAAISMLVTSGELQLVTDAQDLREPKQLAERFLGEADLVLAEGFSHATGPKIEVLRSACSVVPRCKVEDGLVAMVTDLEGVYPDVPHFGMDDIGGIATFLLEQK